MVNPPASSLPYPQQRQRLCVVIHDVAPATWSRCERVISAVNEVGVAPLTLLAVPDYHRQGQQRAFEMKLNDRRLLGDELVLHGYSHWDEKPCTGIAATLKRKIYTRNEGEFSALNAAEAQQRLQQGIDWFRRNNWPLGGFVAPAWLLSADSWAALRQSAFFYTATLTGLHALPNGPSLRSQAMVYSTASAWRRQLSLRWNNLLAKNFSRRNTNTLNDPLNDSSCDPAVIRLELHPGDADYPDIRKSWQRIFAALREGRQLSTLGAAVVSTLLRQPATAPIGTALPQQIRQS